MPLTTTNFLKEQIIADKNSAKCENKQSFVYPNELSLVKNNHDYVREYIGLRLT